MYNDLNDCIKSTDIFECLQDCGKGQSKYKSQCAL